MLSWLRSFFSRQEERALLPVVQPPPPPTASQPPPAPSQRSIPASPSRRFRSPAVTALFSESEDLCHPEYPFLDRSYSPGSYMPAADFSPWIAARRKERDAAGIEELLGYLAYATHAKAVQKTMAGLDVRRFIKGDDALLNELWAVMFLGYRYIETGHESSRIALLREIIAHTLACWPFELIEDGVPHLLEGANKFIRQQNRAMKDVRPPAPLLDSAYLGALNVSPVSRFGEELRTFPVTFRAMIAYSIQRGSPVIGCIRPQLGGHYGLRQFGLSTELNRRRLATSQFFRPPDDLHGLALRLKKDELQEIATTTGLVFKKSAKKDDLVALLLANDHAKGLLGQRSAGELIQLVPEYRPSFDSWQTRVVGLQQIALCLACA